MTDEPWMCSDPACKGCNYWRANAAAVLKRRRDKEAATPKEFRGNLGPNLAAARAMVERRTQEGATR